MQRDGRNRGGWDRGAPPDLMDLVSKARQRFWRAGKRGHGKGFLVARVLVILILLFTGFYTIGPDEMGGVQRFSKYVRTEAPGLHFKIPFGVEKLTPVKTARVWKEKFGFPMVLPGIRTKYVKRDREVESLMVTEDLNVIDVKVDLQFRIDDPVKFLFKVKDVKAAIRDLWEALVRRVVGNRGATDVLTVGRRWEIPFRRSSKRFWTGSKRGFRS